MDLKEGEYALSKDTTVALWKDSYREIGGQKDYAVFGHCVIQCP